MPLAAIPLGAWIAGSAAVGAGASIYGANKAAKTSQSATDQTLAIQQQQQAQSREDSMPFAQGGYGAVNAITGRLGIPSAASAPAGAMPSYANADTFNNPGPQSNLDGTPYTGTVGANAVTTAAPNAMTTNVSGGSTVEPGTYGSTSNPTFTAPGYTQPDAFSYGLADYKASPSFQFELEQGRKAITAGQAYKGALDSGATGKALAEYSQNLAYKDFAAERTNAQNEYTDQRNFDRGVYDDNRDFSRTTYADDRDYLTNRSDTQTGNLFNLAGMGQAAVAGQAASGANYANSATNAITSNASNKINAGLATSSSINNLIGQGVNAAAYYYR